MKFDKLIKSVSWDDVEPHLWYWFGDQMSDAETKSEVFNIFVNLKLRTKPRWFSGGKEIIISPNPLYNNGDVNVPMDFTIMVSKKGKNEECRNVNCPNLLSEWVNYEVNDQDVLRYGATMLVAICLMEISYYYLKLDVK